MNYFLKLARKNDFIALNKVLIVNGQKSIPANINSGFFLYAAFDGKIIGLIGVELCGKNALIRSLSVLPAFRRHGIASDLFCNMSKMLQKKQVIDMYLLSKDAGEFWKAMGFNQCAIHKLVENVPDAEQIAYYNKTGTIWNDVSCHRKLLDTCMHAELTDKTFIRQMHDGSLSPKIFSHEAHIRLVWIYLVRYEREIVIDKVVSTLKLYIHSIGASNKYNATVTVAAIKIVECCFRKQRYHSFRHFIMINSHLVLSFKKTLQLHYSFDVFNNFQAQQQYLEPDLLPFCS